MSNAVTQQELEAFLGLNKTLGTLCNSIRNRIADGAMVEPGRLEATAEKDASNEIPDNVYYFGLEVRESAQHADAPSETAELDFTPPEENGENFEYFLAMNNEDGVAIDDIEMSRAEFISLKSQLARLRGIPDRHFITCPQFRGYCIEANKGIGPSGYDSLLNLDEEGDEVHSNCDYAIDDDQMGHLTVFLRPDIPNGAAARLLRKIAGFVEARKLPAEGEGEILTEHPGAKHQERVRELINAHARGTEAANAA